MVFYGFIFSCLGCLFVFDGKGVRFLKVVRLLIGVVFFSLLYCFCFRLRFCGVLVTCLGVCVCSTELSSLNL